MIRGQIKALMLLLHPSYYFHFPTGNEPENTKFWETQHSGLNGLQSKAKRWSKAIFSGLARKGEKELKAKSERKLAAKLKGRAGKQGR